MAARAGIEPAITFMEAVIRELGCNSASSGKAQCGAQLKNGLGKSFLSGISSRLRSDSPCWLSSGPLRAARAKTFGSEYTRGTVHTNGMERFGSLFKQTVESTIIGFGPFHLHRYLGRLAFRFNQRKGTDATRLFKAANGVIAKSLRNLDLIDGRGGEDLPPQTARAW